MKEKMVTRTVMTTTVLTLGINELAPEAVEERFYTFEGNLTTGKALSMAKKHSEASSYTPAMVKEITVECKVLGVPMSTFMEHAVEVVRPESQRKQG